MNFLLDADYIERWDRFTPLWDSSGKPFVHREDDENWGGGAESTQQ